MNDHATGGKQVVRRPRRWGRGVCAAQFVRQAAGFTLVELLVVIGIIGILIAILVPALNAARQKANAIKCASNLHTLGEAMTLYTTQTKCYPGAVTISYRGVWPARLREVLGGNQEVFYCPSRDPSFAWTPEHSSGFALVEGFGYRPGEPALWTPFSYGYNGMGTDVRYRKRGLGFELPYPGLPVDSRMTKEIKASRVRLPADMVAITDGPLFSEGSPCISFAVIPFLWDRTRPDFEGWTAPAPVHSGGTNVLFCDGHVQWYQTSELLFKDQDAIAAGAPPVSMRDQAVARMWNIDHEP